VGRLMKSDIEASSIETPAPLALLGIIGAASHRVPATTSNSQLITDEHALVRIPAKSRMEDIKKQTYVNLYESLFENWEIEPCKDLKW
jgi:hypothetical protein